jgi:uncharacterized membrane protein
MSDPNTCENCGTPTERLAHRRRLLAAFSYLGALFVLPLILGEKDADVRFHARQGAVMCAAELFAVVVGWIPVVGWSVAFVVWGVAAFAFVRALQGQRWEIPVVSDYAKKLEF